MKKFLILPLVAIAMLASPFLSSANAQGLGCPSELLFTDGSIWVYDASICATGLGGTCTETPTLGVVQFSSAVETGCAGSGEACDCKYLGGAAAKAANNEPFLVKTNGKTFDAKADKVYPGTTVQHFIAKGEVEGKTFYFRIVNGEFKNKNGQKLYVSNCFLIDPSDTPEKCSDATDKTKCTPDDEFITISSVKVTLSDDKKHPQSVEIQKTETGTIYRMNVATNAQVMKK